MLGRDDKIFLFSCLEKNMIITGFDPRLSEVTTQSSITELLTLKSKPSLRSFWILVFLMGEVNPVVVFSSILLLGCVYFYGFNRVPSTAISLDFEKTVTHANLLTTVHRPEVTAVTDSVNYTSKNVTTQPSKLDSIVSDMVDILNGRIDAVDKLNHAIHRVSYYQEVIPL